MGRNNKLDPVKDNTGANWSRPRFSMAQAQPSCTAHLAQNAGAATLPR